jgi:hypothetical protein
MDPASIIASAKCHAFSKQNQGIVFEPDMGIISKSISLGKCRWLLMYTVILGD